MSTGTVDCVSGALQALRCYSRHRDAQTGVCNASVDELASGSVDTRVHAEQTARDRLCCNACVCMYDAQAQEVCVRVWLGVTFQPGCTG